MLFSEWFRAQQNHPEFGPHATAWNALPAAQRKGRINADRLTRLANVPAEVSAKIVAAHKEAHPKTPKA